MEETNRGFAAGEQALAFLGAPLSFNILKALMEGTYDAEGLRRAAGSPPTSTMRLYMRQMEDLRVVHRAREKKFSGSMVCEITPAGEQLFRVGGILDSWLLEGPYGPVSLGTPAAKSNVKALLGGWSTYAIRSLAAKPLRLTELHRFVPQITYPALERRLSAMNHVGQIERHSEDGRGTPYRVTTWLRRAVAPLAVAIGWEGKWVPDLATPIKRADIEALFLLLVPLLELPQSVTGIYRLAVEVNDGAKRDFAGVSVDVEDGRVISCGTRSARMRAAPTIVISGDLSAWVEWIAFRKQTGMTIEGSSNLAKSFATRTRKALKARPQKSLPSRPKRHKSFAN